MNWQTSVVLALVAAIVAAIAISYVRRKRRGATSCGCACEGCAMKEKCRRQSLDTLKNITALKEH